MRVLVLLDLARTLGGGSLDRTTRCLAQFRLWVEQGNHVAQRLGVFAHQGAQFAFELQFFLQLVILRQVGQAGLKFLDGFFGGAVLVDQGHGVFLNACSEMCGAIIDRQYSQVNILLGN
ncbi:hypothetical protein D3C75_738260 [compost metagenome]